MIRTLEAVELIQQAQNEGQIAAHLTAFAAQLGYESWHIARASNSNVPLTRKKVLGVWPTAWLEEYDHRKYAHVDPVAHSCKTLTHAFRWSEVPVTRIQSKRVMAIADTDYRMREGYCVPYFGLDGYQGAISFGGRNVDSSQARDLPLEVVAVFAFNRLNEIKAETSSEKILTPRQREVLQWIAAGKTAWDTAVILNISEETVRTTVKAAMSRLDAHTRAQAIAAALRLKEISA